MPIKFYTGSPQSGDTSDGLQVASSDSLVLNGSTILRVSTYPSQAANLTLVSGSEVDGGGTTSGLPDFLLRGGDNSLPVVIDCSKVPVVKNVTATAFAGEYGAGQRVYFQVRGDEDMHISRLIDIQLSGIKVITQAMYWCTS